MTPRRKYSMREQRAKTPAQRFWEKVDKSADCWLWTAAQYQNGYGTFSFDGTRWRAHRLAYTWLVGPIPEGLEIDHKCHERLCVNPAHLQAVSRGLNAQNIGRPRKSKSGVRGVVWHKPTGLWFARATVDGVSYSGGYHESIPEAEAAVIQLRNRIMTNNLLDRIA